MQAAHDRSDIRARLAAWGVHLLTALGAVVGAWALVAIDRGELAWAAIAMLVAFAIDSIDGTLARAARVAQVVPHVDGRRLDDIVDYLNYVVVPVVFMIAAGNLAHWAWAAAPLLASCYGFANVDAKTDDDFFLGFPSYWNVVALYVWLGQVDPIVTTTLVVGLSVAVFLPLKFLYPSKMHRYQRPTVIATVLWGIALAACVLSPALARGGLLEVSLLFPAYYVVASFVLGGIHRAPA